MARLNLSSSDERLKNRERKLAVFIFDSSALCYSASNAGPGSSSLGDSPRSGGANRRLTAAVVYGPMLLSPYIYLRNCTNSMHKKIALMIAPLAFAALMIPSIASAATLTSAQVSAIIGLLQSFGADAATIANVQAALGGSGTVSSTAAPAPTPAPSGNCVTLSGNLSMGMQGSTIGSLQTFLGVSSSGYFGAQTQAAVKAWQSAHGISTTGTVGPATRAAMACS